MSRTNYFILGNGFSINLIEKINCSEKVDLRNLFVKGDKVPYPDDKDSCFLSRRYCPDLWGLGARSTMSNQQSNDLIRNIITSTNVYYLCTEDVPRQEELRNSSYYKAYCQLISYLKNLFIYYNKLISDSELKTYIDEKNSFINYISHLVNAGQKVKIITYNYDIFLERMLKLKRLDFKIAAFDDIDDLTSIIIYKPHGSISFESRSKRKNGQRFNTEKDPITSANITVKDMKNNLKVSEDRSNINPIIPPAGEGDRLTEGWSTDIKELLKKSISEATSDDKCIIYGISYDHVDRRELDQIITRIPWDIDISYINPYPSATFDMVLGSIFNKYSHYKNFYWEGK